MFRIEKLGKERSPQANKAEEQNKIIQRYTGLSVHCKGSFSCLDGSCLGYTIIETHFNEYFRTGYFKGYLNLT